MDLRDLLAAGRLKAPMRILDAGCGTGRHFPLLLGAGLEVFAVDSDADAAATALALCRADGLLPLPRVSAARVQELPFAEHSFDAMLAVSLLHFARSAPEFEAMFLDLWRVLKPGGLIYLRLDCRNPVNGTDPGNRLEGPGFFLVEASSIEQLVVRAGGEWIESLQVEEVSPGRFQAVLLLRKPR